MAELMFAYRKYYCEFNCPEFSVLCLTATADRGDCLFYHDGEGLDSRVIPFGDCKRAKWDVCYKSGMYKRFETEIVHDEENPHLDCCEVTVSGKVYDCVKVYINGECVYSNPDFEEENT